MFTSFFEDVDMNSVEHNMLIKVMNVKEVQDQVVITVCDLTGAIGLFILNDNQCKYLQLFKEVSIFFKYRTISWV
jgi:hypothetical protein